MSSPDEPDGAEAAACVMTSIAGANVVGFAVTVATPDVATNPVKVVSFDEAAEADTSPQRPKSVAEDPDTASFAVSSGESPAELLSTELD